MNPKSNSHHHKIEIRQSIINPLAISSGIVYLIGFGFYRMTDKAATIGLPVYVLIMIALAFLMLAYVISIGKKAIVMTLTHEGIYKTNAMLIRWDSILWIKTRREQSGEGARLLVLQTIHAAEPHEIDISDMAISEKKLAKQIQQFRPYHIQEVEVD